jgi:hypothetical protein
MSNGRTSTRGNHATRAALPAKVDPLSTTMRVLRASVLMPLRDAPKSRPPSREEVEDTTPFELVDPVNASATVRDIPAATGMSCRRRAQLALAASFVLGLAGYITAAI